MAKEGKGAPKAAAGEMKDADLAQMAEVLRAETGTPDGKREDPHVSAKLALQLVEEIQRLRVPAPAIAAPVRVREAVVACPGCGGHTTLRIDDVFPVKA